MAQKQNKQTPDIPPTAPVVFASSRHVLEWVASGLFVVALIVVVVWYRESATSGRHSVFVPETQVVPHGAKSLGVSQALATLALSTQLPFFDEKNVVQSLSLVLSASSTALIPSSYLSYRILGHTKESLHQDFSRYFQNTGWTALTSSASSTVMFFQHTESAGVVRVVFLDGGDASDTIVALSLLPQRIGSAVSHAP